jgi:hypothetical protein
VHELNPKTYFYNNRPSTKKEIGYIAEEVHNITNHFATYNYPDDTPVGINYDVITVFLVEEVKKLKQQNISLTEKLLALEERLSLLENK